MTQAIEMTVEHAQHSIHQAARLVLADMTQYPFTSGDGGFNRPASATAASPRGEERPPPLALTGTHCAPAGGHIPFGLELRVKGAHGRVQALPGPLDVLPLIFDRPTQPGQTVLGQTMAHRSLKSLRQLSDKSVDAVACTAIVLPSQRSDALLQARDRAADHPSRLTAHGCQR
ncbi:MAG: hypothetical protein A49_09070 [Methyloceanibacter sp.]|nr:MAG: hypothetical protein A49_09070 [Methyloceanibacter sp.]